MQRQFGTWIAAALLAIGASTASAQCCAKPQTAYFMPSQPVTAYYGPVQQTLVQQVPMPQTFVAPQTVMYAPQTSFRPTLVNLPVTAYSPLTNYGSMLQQPAVAYRPVTYYVNQVQWTPYTSYRQVVAPMAVQQAAPVTTFAAPAFAAPAAPTTTYAQPAPATTYAQPAPSTTYAQPAPATTYAQPAPTTTYEQPAAPPSTYPAPSSTYPTPSSPCPPGSMPGSVTPADGSTPPSLLTPPAGPPAAPPGTQTPIPTYEGGSGGATSSGLQPLNSTPSSTTGDDTHSASRDNGARSMTLPQRTDWSYGDSRQKPIPSPLLSATVKNEPRSAEAALPTNAGGWQASRR